MAMADSEASYFEARQARLRERLERRRLKALLISKPANIFYLTGFRGSSAAAVIDHLSLCLLVDPRYTLQAEEQAHGTAVAEVRTGLLPAAVRRLRKGGLRKVGFEDSVLTVADLESLRRESGSGIEWQPSGGIVEDLRVVKDDLEIGLIRQACRLTSRVFEQVARKVKPGISESDLASEIEFRMRRRGAEGAAFDSIVASGPRGALPHAAPSAKLLKSGEFVILDLGAVVSGYCADMTRTLYLGKPSRRARMLYAAVREAQEAGVGCVRPGVRADKVDSEVRRRLAKRNLDHFFTHSTGHGVGIEIHERPRFGKSEKYYIPARSVVTIEPGIYFPGFGGIRIEDTVLAGEEGPEVLTAAAKDHWFSG
ncbi:MAG: M24 family metallopeptidase [Terriglobia bacterium]